MLSQTQAKNRAKGSPKGTLFLPSLQANKREGLKKNDLVVPPLVERIAYA
jgi:hypothetical protein